MNTKTDKLLILGEEWEPGYYAEPYNVRKVLAGFMRDIGACEIEAWLKDTPSDSYDEEYMAIDRLNELTTNGYWTIDQGLYLVKYNSDLDKAFQTGA